MDKKSHVQEIPGLSAKEDKEFLKKLFEKNPDKEVDIKKVLNPEFHLGDWLVYGDDKDYKEAYNQIKESFKEIDELEIELKNPNLTPKEKEDKEYDIQQEKDNIKRRQETISDIIRRALKEYNDSNLEGGKRRKSKKQTRKSTKKARKSTKKARKNTRRRN